MSLRRFVAIREVGPFRNLLLGFCFFLIIIASFDGKVILKRDFEVVCFATLITKSRQISPLTEYLYLKPLYSILGGSTTRADPLTNKLVLVTLRWKPL